MNKALSGEPSRQSNPLEFQIETLKTKIQAKIEAEERRLAEKERKNAEIRSMNTPPLKVEPQPVAKSGDIAHSLAKSLLSAVVPITGSAVADLLAIVLGPPIEKRKSKWLDHLAECVSFLIEKKSLDVETLHENDAFIDAVSSVTASYLKTSDQEKIKYLKNALVNTALMESPDKTKIQIFINAVDSLTSMHIKLLSFANDPDKQFADSGRTKGEYGMTSFKQIIKDGSPELGSLPYLDLMWNDLQRLGFHNADLGTSTGSPGLYNSRTLQLGKEFLNFISNYE